MADPNCQSVGQSCCCWKLVIHFCNSPALLVNRSQHIMHIMLGALAALISHDSHMQRGAMKWQWEPSSKPPRQKTACKQEKGLWHSQASYKKQTPQTSSMYVQLRLLLTHLTHTPLQHPRPMDRTAFWQWLSTHALCQSTALLSLCQTCTQQQQQQQPTAYTRDSTGAGTHSVAKAVGLPAKPST